MNLSQQAQFEQVKAELLRVLPRLLRYARNLCGNLADAEDLLQSTSERVLSRWQQFKPDTEFDRWAFTVMHSIRNNALRSEAVRLGQGHENAADTLLAPESESPEGNKFFDQVLDRIGKLPDGQRQVMLLVYIEGYSYAAAAGILEIPVGTVMSRIGRARVKLANELNTADVTQAAPISVGSRLESDGAGGKQGLSGNFTSEGAPFLCARGLNDE